MIHEAEWSEERTELQNGTEAGKAVTWQQVLRDAQENCAVDQSDALLLLEYVSGYSRSEIRLRYREAIPETVAERFAELLEFRKQHIPVQYITGQQNFMGFELSVTPDVLIPRPETELLAERVIQACEGKDVLDLCTGSGCIAIAVRCLGNAKRVAASDISEAALAVAIKNAKAQGAEIEFRQGDLFEAWSVQENGNASMVNAEVTEQIDNGVCTSCRAETTSDAESVTGIRRFDIIVSNPPYIPTAEIAGLMPEVREYEPHLALDGTEDGLLFYRRIAADCRKYLNPGGRVFLEIGCEQGRDVTELFRKAGFANVQVYQDYAGLDRMVEAKE